MKYEIKGGTLPVLECTLESGESMISQNGGMSWMSSNISMNTTSAAGGNGGLGKILGRIVTGESIFQNVFTCNGGQGVIAFTSSFPGAIVAVHVTPGHDIICQKKAFLASTQGITLSTFFQKKLGAGFLGGEGFLMERLSGEGIAFLEIDGSFTEYTLAQGQQMIIDQGHLATMDATCTIDIVFQKGIKNLFLSGNGMCNAIVTGPGKIGLQSMPIQKLANCLIPYLPKPENDHN